MLNIEVKNSPIIWMKFDQFINGILTWFDCISSFRNLRIILSDLRFHNTFQFVKYK